MRRPIVPHRFVIQQPVSKADQLLRLYEDASATCRNYSTLTMHVRTVAAVVLAGGSGAVVIAMAQEHVEAWPIIVVGLLICTLTVMLALTNWHYQSAFEVVRNHLADMEREHFGGHGPWCAHQSMRDQQNDLLSSYGPFVVLALAGTFTLALGGYFLHHRLPEAIRYGAFAAIGFLILARIIQRNEARATAAARHALPAGTREPLAG